MIIRDEFVQRQLDTVWGGWKITGELESDISGPIFEIQRDDTESDPSFEEKRNLLKVLYLEEHSDGMYGFATSDSKQKRAERNSDRGKQGRLESGSLVFSHNIKHMQSSLDEQLANSSSLRVAADRIDRFAANVGSEIQRVVRLKGHPNIEPAEDYYVTSNNRSCLVMIRMEKLDSISNYLREGSNILPVDEVIHLGIDICRALEVYETKNVVHGNINPENLFFGKESGFKLGDFGISRTLESFCGTSINSEAEALSYMAPEVYAGKKRNHSTDIYSLGMVLYQLMNESYLPFIRENLQNAGERREHDACLRRMRGEKLPTPERADRMLADILIKACSCNPNERFSSAKEFRNALESCLNEKDAGKGIAIYKDGWNRLDWTVKLAICLLLAALLVTAGYHIGKSGKEEETAQGIIPASEGAEEDEDTTGQELADQNTEDEADASQELEEEELTDDALTAGTGETIDLDEELTFADPALEKAIREEMRLTEDEPITRGAALEIEALNLGGGGKEDDEKITDLTGLSAFSNVKELDLRTNGITRIDELSGLKKLEELVLESNHIRDLTPLAELEDLRKLEAAKNDIYDFSPIMGLRNLEVLDLIENHIDSIKGIGKMAKINELHLGHNSIEDISPVTELRDLTHLSFGYNKVEDISCLEELPMLHVLTMSYNQIHNLGPIADMPELDHLEVRNNPLDEESIAILDSLEGKVKHIER